MAISFACPGCGKNLNVSDAAAGKKGKCPGCQGALVVPATTSIRAAGAFMAPLAAGAKAPGASAGAGSFLSLKKLVLAGVGVVLILATAATGYMLLSSSAGSLSDDLVYMPDECVVIGSVRMDEVLNSGAYTDFQKKLKEFSSGAGLDSDMEKDSEHSVGTPVSNMTAIRFGVNADNKGVIIYHTKEAVDAKTLLSKMKKKHYNFENGDMKAELKPRKFKEEKVGDHALYVEEGRFARNAFFLPQAHVIVSGQPDVLRSVAQRNQKAMIPEELQAVLNHADTSRTFYVAMNLKKAPKGMGLSSAPVDTRSATAACIDGDMAEAADLTCTVFCQNTDSAKKLHQDIQGQLSMLKAMAGSRLPPELKQALDSLQFSTSDNRLSVKLSIQPSVVLSAFQMGSATKTTFKEVGEPIQGGPQD